jgi:acetylornithine deacetylase
VSIVTNRSEPVSSATAKRDHEEREAMAQRLLALCAVDSTTGREDALLPVLPMLRASDARVDVLPVAGTRANVLATWSDQPRLLFSTHLDTVPPYLPPTRAGDRIAGRGTIDAKGQIVVQLSSIERLLRAGERDLAWLGVVGEETDSIGARAATTLVPRLTKLRAVLNGEPTGNRLATGQRGILHLRLQCAGRAAHSATPEVGRSAIWPLLEWLHTLRAQPRPVDPDLGPEIWNLGLIAGGRAPNVVPDLAHAELFVRALPGSDFAALAQRLAPDGGRVELLHQTAADRFPRLDGFSHALVPFGSDAPRLRVLVPDRTVVLAGPGAIELAHSTDEHVTLPQLADGVDLLCRLASHFTNHR